MKTGRLEAFSDGVFAIAITLLIIDVKVPEVDSGLWHALRDQWSVYAGFLVSFLTIGVIWVNHHSMFDHIVKANEQLLYLNLVLLMTVSFIPFPTALLAHYLEAGHDARIAAAVFSATMLAMGIAYTAVWMYALRTPGLIDSRFDPGKRRTLLWRSLLGCGIYALSFVAAAIDARLALAFYAAVTLLFIVRPKSGETSGDGVAA